VELVDRHRAGSPPPSLYRDVAGISRAARPTARRDVTHRDALAAALRQAAILERRDPRGDPYGAAGQALEDFVRREDQIVANGEDVSGWISVATERRWINELRYQARRRYARLDGPADAATTTTLGDLIADRGPATHEMLELRERLRDVAVEQCAALAHLRASGVQERHVRVVELALGSVLRHHEIAQAVNSEFADRSATTILGNTVTQIIGRQRDRLEAGGEFPSVVARLRGARRAVGA
jgi:hypothetical protein